ncbi:MAG: CDP-alcohol phosphatidyltransferase family protein [Wenzhouxiangellaceae bacterium]|nr:CDP-alcohol phosphatidyltransferase family protein [Wenzhouxiangellaceae bacterium]
MDAPEPELFGLVIGGCETPLWHVPPHERALRLLGQLGIARQRVRFDENPEAAEWPASSRVLIIRVDWLYEPRTLAPLLQSDGSVLLCAADNRACAACGPSDRLDVLAEAVADRASPSALGDDCTVLRAGDLTRADARLRRATPPLLAAVTPQRAAQLEAELYGNAYKGVTDLVTKWLWPRPSAWLVRRCAALGLSPNQVTLISLLLVILAGVLFARGQFTAGLLAGWVMTLLDTVDGKLARVTLQSSRIGGHFDHGIDLIHPPFWYLAWALGLAGASLLPDALSVTDAALWIFIPYIVGRLSEGIYGWTIGGTMFLYRPFDSWFRLIMARRNPALILLTGALLIGRPDLGLLAVIGWSLISVAVQVGRLLAALIGWARSHQRPTAWLTEPSAEQRYPRSFATFAATRGAFRR